VVSGQPAVKRRRVDRSSSGLHPRPRSASELVSHAIEFRFSLARELRPVLLSITVTKSPSPRVTVIVLNFNGHQWLTRCVDSLRRQTIFEKMEVILADNASTDGSDKTAEELIAGWSNGRFMQNGTNLGFAEGNNRPAEKALGKFLFFLNNDAWLEPDCIERLLDSAETEDAAAATPLVLNYDDDSFQSAGAFGFDIFGLPTDRRLAEQVREILMPEGCSYLIHKDVFDAMGGFDPRFFMYAEELDLSWRVWIAGHRIITVPDAIVHHRGAANVNPAGGSGAIEFRTSDTKRYYANRNALLTLLKSGEHLVFLFAALQTAWLVFEAFAALILIHRWSFVQRAYVDALRDCWRMRHHVIAERRRIRQFRRRSDFSMLRFFRLRLNRWDELRRVIRHGMPKITPR
jgi:N-acetylglucosaminyl-diphospho-decaprenol L-rhamnosyltransferase